MDQTQRYLPPALCLLNCQVRRGEYTYTGVLPLSNVQVRTLFSSEFSHDPFSADSHAILGCVYLIFPSGFQVFPLLYFPRIFTNAGLWNTYLIYIELSNDSQ